MKLLIEPTKHFFMADEVMVRMWQGVTDSGQECVVLVTAVAFPGDAPALVEGLVAIPPPDAAAAQRWAEHIMAKHGGSDAG